MSSFSIPARPLVRWSAVPVIVTGLGILGAGAASAHVTVTPSATEAGSYAVATFSVPHGCDGSPTTKVAISIPEGVNSVTPTRNPLYDLEKVTEALSPPVTDAHGNELSERVGQVVYTAKTPLPDGQRDVLELQFQIPADAAGKTLLFPVVQTCEQGETAWVDATPEGGEEPEHPAPAFTVTAASSSDGHGDDAAAGGDEEAAGAVDSSDADDDGSSTGLAWAGLVVGVLGLAAGGTALIRSRKS